MYHIIGPTKTKDTGLLTKSCTLPTSEARIAADNSLWFTYSPGINFTYSQSRDTIVYTTKPKTLRQRANFCIHTVDRQFYSGDPSVPIRLDHIPHPTFTEYYVDYAHHETSRGSHVNAYTAFLAAVNPIGEACVQANGQAWIDQGFVDLKPDLTIASIPNSLAEIGDIRQMFDLWRASAGIARNLAGLHLNYNFGVKPFIGDVQSILNSAASLQTKLAEWNKRLNTISHRSKVMFQDTETEGGTITDGDKKTYYHGTVKRTATAHIAYRTHAIQALSALDLQIRGMLDTLGFELNPRIAWDALPFTFVVDWFFNVGNALEAFKVDALELPITLVDTYISYKEEIRMESKTGIVDNRSDFTHSMSGGWTQYRKFFLRTPIAPKPESFSVLGWRRPTTHQTQLLLSLGTVLGSR